jgi:hypothetical protein
MGCALALVSRFRSRPEILRTKPLLTEGRVARFAADGMNHASAFRHAHHGATSCGGIASLEEIDVHSPEP